ncbi:MAG TPA: (4Fe-4S)-binding protein [Phycisphaerales bacterium]|nr:(4Fe-4S)-binding protein [Phycisphaerales bacterium]
MNGLRTIAVASGKGGTGKTTVATNLAVLLARQGHAVQYIDGDVEAPNGHIFLRPDITHSRCVTVPVPTVDSSRCTGCGRCGQICQFKAIVPVKSSVLTFEQLCHSCGGCLRVCPVQAIEEKPLDIGRVDIGRTDGPDFVQGTLRIGSVRSVALIRAVRTHAADRGVVILDAPPGTSCPVIAAVRGVDFVLLVTEPTPFGLHDLKLAAAMVRHLGLAHGVVINRSGLADEATEMFCRGEGIEILARIPDDRRIAETYSNGGLILDVAPNLGDIFSALARRLLA